MPDFKKIEIILWERCNCRCAFCTSGKTTDSEYSFEQAVAALRQYRDRGADGVAFGGGEPTVFENLPGLAAVARALGYSHIEIKSNGMRFCYPEYVTACLSAGVTLFTVSLWGHAPDLHDNLAGRTGAFEMTEMGLKHLAHYGADVAVDFLLTTQSLPHVDAALGLLDGIGIRRASLWLFCVFGAGGRHAHLVPRLSHAGPALARAADRFPQMQLFSTHIPPCCMNGRADLYRDIRDMQLLIVTRGHDFMAEESPFEKGRHTPACARCALKTGCPGPREEYLNLFGDDEIQPVKKKK